MKVKLFYANWNKIRGEDEDRSMFSKVSFEGLFLEQRPDLYDLVFEWEFEAGATPEDFLFQQFNIGDHGGKRTIRSMSVGDVVVYEGKAVVCKGMGWETLDAPAWMVERTGEVSEQDGDPPEIRIARRMNQGK